MFAKSTGPNPSSRHAPPGYDPGGIKSDVCCTYEYQVGWSTNHGTGTTSGSVQVVVKGQGVDEPDKDNITGSDSNHTLADFPIFGSGADSPLVEITISTGQEYCNSGWEPCFRAFTWKSGAWTQETGYVDVSGGVAPNDGTAHPATDEPITLGYNITSTQFQVLLDGTEVGYVPLSYWGGSWGTTTNEVDGESLDIQDDYSGTPIPSMNYAFSNYTDSNGDDTLQFNGNTTTGYTSTDVGTDGFTTSGGVAPTDSTTTYWPMQGSEDNTFCLTDYHNLTTSGNPIVVEPCTSQEQEVWRYNSSTTHVIELNGLCLDDPGDSQTAGTQLEQVTCSTTDHGQDWDLSEVSNGSGSDYLELIDYSGDMCVANPTNSTTDGAPVKVEACDAVPGKSQMWDWVSPTT